MDGAPGGADTDVLLYNPNATTITIDWATTAGSGSFTMAANETAFFQAKTGAYVPDGSALYLKGTGVFWGISDIDTNSSSCDWGYSLVPSYLLKSDQFVSWAPGNTPVQNPPGTDGRAQGIFVTPVQDKTTFFVDRNGDGVPETTFEVLRGATVVASTGGGYQANRLESLYITDDDGDMTGAHIWATGPFAMAYGENPQRAGASGGVDLGYTVLPSPADWMELALTVEKATNPTVISTVAGATTATYTIQVDSHLFNLTTVDVVDTLPANWEYIANSSTITFPNLTQLTGAAAEPTVALPTLTWPTSLLGGMLPNQRITITFQARTTANFTSGALTQNNVQAIGTRSVGAVTSTFRATDFVFNTYLNSAVNNMTVAKVTGATDPVSPGDTIPYTVTVSNPGSGTLTGVNLFDPIPEGVTYVAGSGWVSCGSAASRTYVDNFGTVAFDNSNGTADWSGNPWVETDGLGGGAATGFVRVSGGALQMRYTPPTVADDFATQGYSGNTGSTTWATSWDETGDDDSPTGGTIGVDGSQRIEFRGGTAAAYSIQREANVPAGTTAVTVSFLFDPNNALDADDDLIAEYSADGGGSWNTLGTFDGDSPDDTTHTFPLVWNTANTSIVLRFRAEDAIEVDEEGRFDNVQIAFNSPSDATGSIAQRTANLTGATAASLTFTSAQTGLGTGDVVVVEAASSPSGPFTVLATATSTGAFTPALTANNLLPYVSATTTIRFRITGGFSGATDSRTIDALTITYTSTGFPASDPPTFLPASAGCSIVGGGTATLTFSVTVDNPFPAGQTEIVNVATAIANEIPIPISDDARNIVLNPAATSATVGDRVWLDADGDGSVDVGEAGLGGVQLTLKDQWGTPLQVTTTDSQGRYTFVGVPPGSGYYVEVSGGLPGGLTQTTDGRTDQRTNSFTLAAGDVYDTADLGFRASPGTATIGDLVWSDADGDGVRDPGEPGLAGVVLNLLEDTNGDGIGDANPKECFGVIRPEPAPYAACTTTSAADGSYLFSGIVANGTRDYFVTVDSSQTALASYTATTPLFAGFLNVPAGAGYTTADFGFEQTGTTTTWSITDRVWLDNGSGTGGIASNGTQDGTEPGISGVTVALLDAGGNIIATTTSGANGNFQFTGVPAGQNYRWQVTDTFGVLTGYYGTTTPAQTGQYQMTGNLAGNLDFTTAPTFGPHFGYNVTRAIGDTVFNDSGAGGGTAGDGIQNGTEAGISGVTVQLFLDRDNDGIYEPTGADGPAVATLTTDANGKYLFAGLPDGRYWVSIDNGQSALSGYTTLTTGDDEGNAGHQREVLLSGASNLGIDYGYRSDTSYALSGRLWNDVNANGADDSEAGLAGVTLELVRNGVVIGTATTDASGNYDFGGLPGGSDYTVRITDVNGVLSGYTTTFERTELTVGPFNSQETVTNLGGNVSNINFGLYRPVPVPVSLAWFRAEPGRNGVLFEWETSVEAGNVGFNLYGETGGKQVPLNELLIPSKVVDSLWPVAYTYEAPTEATRFWLEEVDLLGNTRRHGPFDLDVEQGRPDEREAVAWDSVRKESDEKEMTRLRNAAAAGRPGGVGSSSTAGVPPVARLLVSSDGMVRVTYEALAAAGFDYVGASTNALVLSNGGREVPMLVTGATGSASQFGPGGSIVFWGERLQSAYTDANAYRLSVNKVPMARPSRIKLVAEAVNLSAKPAASYRETVRVDRNLGYSFSSPTGDPWFEKRILAYTTPAQETFNIDARNAVSGANAELTVSLWGSTDWTADPDHHVVVRWNGSTVGDRVFDGITGQSFKVSFPAAQVNEGLNEIEVVVPGDTGVAYDLVMVDSYSLTYSRAFRAIEDRLAFSASFGPYAVEDLSSSQAYVFWKTPGSVDVSLGTSSVVEKAGTGYRVRFGTSFKGATRQYRVTTATGFLTPRIEPARTVTSLLTGTPAKMLIVAHPDFVDGIEPLAAARRAAGVSVKVVDVRDVYESYSAGNVDPYAIRELVKLAYSRWKTRSVLLVGGDTYDYFDYLKLGSKSFVPTLYAATDPDIVRWAPADPLFGDVNGDGVPEVAIGRLPVRTAAELATVVAKTLSFTRADAAVLAADLPDGDISFSAISDTIGTKVPAGLPVTRAYMGTLGVPGARSVLRAAMNQGGSVVNYFGHSSYTRWSFSGLFLMTDAAALTNAGRPLLVSQFGCWNNYFVDPKYDTLGHMLLLSGDRGAAATLGTATMTELSAEAVIAPILMQKLFVRGKTVGQALVEAKAELARSAPGQADIQAGLTLLGDPELVVNP